VYAENTKESFSSIMFLITIAKRGHKLIQGLLLCGEVSSQLGKL